VSAPLPPEPDRDILESSPRWGRAAALLERVPRWLTLTVAALLLAAGGSVLAIGHGGHPAPRHASPAARAFSIPAACDPFDDATSAHLSSDFRVVLGGVAVAPVRLPSLLRVQSFRPPGAGRPWRYEWKTEFAYRGGQPPVTISVPAGWQRRVGLFGAADGTGAAASALHIPRCPPRGSWNTFSWTFYVSTPAACAPLRVRAAGRNATVWFGFGAHCPAGVRTGRA
jgi:hypothetical protein